MLPAHQAEIYQHLYLAFQFHRDDFARPDASLSCTFVPQGLFRPPGFIPSLLFSPQGLFLSVRFISGLLFCSTGIISFVQIHPQPALFLHRDYFYRSDSSLACSFVPQGLFRPPGFIPTSRFPPLRMHLCKVSL